jgi:hypothetical protein
VATTRIEPGQRHNHPVAGALSGAESSPGVFFPDTGVSAGYSVWRLARVTAA